MTTLQQRILSMLHCFRKEWHLFSDSERTTVCGADCMLMALQLSVAEVNKKSQPLTQPFRFTVSAEEAREDAKHFGDFKASLSEVVLHWNYLLPDKLGILQNNVEAPENYEDIKSTYASFLEYSNMMDLIDVYQKCVALALENESISAVQLLEFIVGTVDAIGESDSISSVPSTPANRISQDNEELPLIVKKILHAYLSLLVNSKNDLAFAHILNIPERGLGREAFTDLKHAARKKHLPMFLVMDNEPARPINKHSYHDATSKLAVKVQKASVADTCLHNYYVINKMAASFIRAIELGGKGYAPSADDPLRSHVKGFSHLIHFIDKLEDIIGEVLDPRLAGGQILSTIKIHLIKGRNSRDPFCGAVEEVVQDLDLRIKNIINFQHEVVTTSTAGISPARPKLHCINHGTRYCGRDTVKALLVLLDEAAAQLPSKNKAQLLFGEEFGFSSTMLLFRSPAQSSGCSPKALRQRFQTAACEKKLKLKQPLIRSQFACTYKDDQITEAKSQHFITNQVPTCTQMVPKTLAAMYTEDKSIAENFDYQVA
ncbi:PCNA-interacting partner [Varanus komodoensis]|nr:PCNA-interacting partner [Varanus komodoensis]